MDAEFLQILVCPICKGKLKLRKQKLICSFDGLVFKITDDDIPVLLAEEATPLSDADSDASSDSAAD